MIVIDSHTIISLCIITVFFSIYITVILIIIFNTTYGLLLLLWQLIYYLLWSMHVYCEYDVCSFVWLGRITSI